MCFFDNVYSDPRLFISRLNKAETLFNINKILEWISKAVIFAPTNVFVKLEFTCNKKKHDFLKKHEILNT